MGGQGRSQRTRRHRSSRFRSSPTRTRIQVDGHRSPTARAWTLHRAQQAAEGRDDTHDPEGRTTVYDLLADVDARVVPVGRLDSPRPACCSSPTTPACRLADRSRNRYRPPLRRDRARRTVRRIGRALERGSSMRGEALTAATIDVLKRSKRETHIDCGADGRQEP